MKFRSFGLPGLLAVVLCPSSHAASTELPLIDRPISLQARVDSIRLPGSERMGTLTTGLLVQLSDTQWAGPAVVSAITGQRGGLFVLGGQWESRWPLSEAWQAQLSLFAGGGGGANAPVGSGLLVQPAVALVRRWGPWQAGLTGSRAVFTDGRIHSNQMGLLVQWNGEAHHFDASTIGDKITWAPPATGLGLDRLMPTLTRYSLRHPSASARQSVDLIGIRGEQDWCNGFYGGLETAAAIQGGADGYMEILGLAGWRSAPWGGPSGMRLGAKLAAGAGGGGAIPTGGGAIGKLAGTASWGNVNDWFVGAEAGWANSLRSRPSKGPLQARYAQVFLGVGLEPIGKASGVVNGMEWAATMQQATRAKRKSGQEAPSLTTLGIKANYWASHGANAHWYWTGQAHSAFAGHAGAYSVGLFGLGWSSKLGTHHDPAPVWRGEITVGAAGGGGVETKGGAVAQALASIAWPTSKHSLIQLGLGRMKSLKPGGLDSPIIDLTWSTTIGVSSPAP